MRRLPCSAVALALAFVPACGRIGFDSQESSGTQVDASPPPDLCWDKGYCFRREITIDSSHVYNRDQLDFPVLIAVSDADLSTRQSGGRVENASGHDIVFASDLAGQIPLKHELESYDGTTGAMHAWVSLPVLSSSADTTFYMFYGNPGVVGSQQDVAGTWDSSFQGVWHFAEAAWTGAQDEVVDSAGSNEGTVQFDAAQIPEGRFSKGALFDTDDDHIDAGNNSSLQSPSITVEVWAKPQSIDSAPNRHPYMITQDRYRTVGPQGYYMEVYRTQTDHRATFYTGNGVEIAHAFSTTLLANDIWYQVVGTHEASTGTTTIYVNGQAEATRIMTAGGLNYDPAKPVKIGGVDQESWNGVLDEVRISSTARSADWIRTGYDNQSSPNTFYSIGAAASP